MANEAYTPPGVTVITEFENPTQALPVAARIPVLVGTGQEILEQKDLEVARGSASNFDTQVVNEDLTGRSVVQITVTEEVILGDFDGVRRWVQVRNFPIVTGDGSATVATDTSVVTVKLNGAQIVVLSIDGEKGLLELSTPPKLGDRVTVTYFFDRTDTLITDDLSQQVTQSPATIFGLKGENYIFTADQRVLNIRVDEATTVSVTFGIGTKNAATVISLIQAAAFGTSLVPSQYTNNFGQTAIVFRADRSIEILDGSANSILGLTAGQKTNRNKVFTTFQGPIVDGSGGGVTTTDPSKVTVRVNGVLVTATAVDGQNRRVTLPFAPEVGSTVKITYYFNAYQDTFDYLAHTGITQITQCGIIPGNSDYINKVDFVLKDDKIVWGAATLIEDGTTAAGSVPLSSEQITATLIDARWFLAPCQVVVDQTVSPPLASKTEFLLPTTPTTGNGRDTPLSQELYASVANGRIDLPTNRPDLVTAYWGFGVQDALDRGPVPVIKVEGTKITLQSPVPVGAGVWATFWYNLLIDQKYTVQVDVEGPSGIGTYYVFDSNLNPVYTPKFGTKGPSLVGLTLQFPSGSELLSDVHFEPGSLKGPVEESVTVTFANKDATLAKFSFPNSGPYFTIGSASDHARILVDSASLASGAAGINLNAVNGIAGLGFPASLMGQEIVYTEDSGQTTYDIETGINDQIALTVDGVTMTMTVPPFAGADASNYVRAINQQSKTAAFGPEYLGASRFQFETVITANVYDQIRYYYTGATTGPSGILTGTIVPGIYNTPTQLAVAVETAIASVAPPGLVLACDVNAEGRLLFRLEAIPALDIGASATGSAVVNVAPVAGDTLTIGGVALTAVNGVQTSGANDFDISSGNIFLIANNIATAVTDPLNSFVDLVTALAVGNAVNFTAAFPGSGGNDITLVSSTVAITVSGPTLAGGTDAGGGYVEFLENTPAPERDFAVLAGLSTNKNPNADQVKILFTDIARRFTVAGTSGRLIYDRIILRSRLVPGGGTLSPFAVLDQTGIQIEGNSAITETGLLPQTVGMAGIAATVQPATILGLVGFTDGQVPAGTYGDERDGQPIVKFFADGAADPQNNVFKLNIDGFPLAIVFTDGAGAVIPNGSSAEVPFGPVSIANTVLAQIRAAAVAVGLPTATVLQEGAGFRVVSSRTDDLSRIDIGEGNANSRFSLVGGATATRTSVDPKVMASALMAHHAASLPAFYTGYQTPASSYFAAQALAGVVLDGVGAEYLYIQSQANNITGLGPSSNLTLQTPSLGNGSWLLQGTGLGATAGQGAAGEPGISGFFVTSSDPVDGSGTVNNSVLNNGTGQDGFVGSTYVDEVTGLAFTVLPREGGGSYPTGPNAFFTFEVRKLVVTDANIPVSTLPGVNLVVTNTTGVVNGNTAIVETIERGGAEPAVGDIYYVTYNYVKQEEDFFKVLLFTDQKTVQQFYGPALPDNAVSLATFLAFQNTANIVGVQQIPKAPNSNQALNNTYIDAFNSLAGLLPGGVYLDTITPLIGMSEDSLPVFTALSKHCDIQSSPRLQAERTAIVGCAAGTQTQQVTAWASALNNTRMRILYPDIVYLRLQDPLGAVKDFLVDGTYLAAAWAGNRASAQIDVATPWIRGQIVGFQRLARILQRPDQDFVASRGVVILEDRSPIIIVRDAATTNPSNVVTRSPQIITIVDYVARRTRADLDRFIGGKNLPGIISQIEGQVSMTLKQIKNSGIIASYQAVKAKLDPTDVTRIQVSASYVPIFGIERIIVTYLLRTTAA